MLGALTVMSKTCIFCGQKGKKSKEHLWPVWMHEYLGKEGDGNNIRESTSFKNREHIGGSKLERQGYLFTTKFRVVCRGCNNGWMSKLEETRGNYKACFIKACQR